MLRSIVAQHVQGLRLAVVGLAILVYLAVDGVLLVQHERHIQWDMSVNAHGIITWVDPNGPASTAGLLAGDQVMLPSGRAADTSTELDRQPALRIRHMGAVRVVRADPVFGPSVEGQLLILIALPLILIGGLAWAAGHRRAPPTLLGILSAMVALSLLGDVWGHDGVDWAMRLVAVAAPFGFPLAWAALFLTFPHYRLGERRWHLGLATLCALALVAVVVYVLGLFVVLPDVLTLAFIRPVLPFGLLLGLAGLCLRAPGETRRIRQQRRLVGLSAACAVLPFLLLSFVPRVILGQPLIPFELSAFAFLLLPLGFAYAMARYDLMELDVVVRRLAAAFLATMVLLAITLLLGAALAAFLPGEGVVPIAVCLVIGARGTIDRGTRSLAERLLSPELVQSRALLTTLDAAALRGVADLPELAGQLEAAVRVLSRSACCRFLVRCLPGTSFAGPQPEAPVVALPALTAALCGRPWGLTVREAAAPDEWAVLASVLDAVPAVLAPVTVRSEVIGLVLVGERSREEPLRGPDREALALLIDNFAPELDYARVRADLGAKLADAAALSAASARLTAALGDWDALIVTVVDSLASQPGIRDVALVLAGSDTMPEIAAMRGTVEHPVQQPLAEASFSLNPRPTAWLPLHTGAAPIGSIFLRWHAGYAVGEHEYQLLTIYAGSVATALERARLYKQAQILAERDPVTDLYNYRAFHTRLEEALEQARQTDGQVGLLLLDLVNFKLFNDTYGHQAGDRALQHVGEVLRASGRKSDLAARLGGDEFAVVLPGADSDATCAIAERITALAAQSALTAPEGVCVPIQLSIGAVSFPQDADTINTLLARADERMYEAKRAGVAVSGGQDNALEVIGSSKHFGVLEALVAMVDNRDRYTAEHSEQVATYACALGAALGLSHMTIETLRIAGLLHDVGKIGVPDRILRKPGRLTDEEFEIVRRHVELSEALVTVVARDRDLIDAIAHHHERWDGTGYPRRVEGEAVPLLGRVMIVADAVSAMAMDRPYRKGLSWETIAAELVRGAGSQFDPALVPLALRALRPLIKQAYAAPA